MTNRLDSTQRAPEAFQKLAATPPPLPTQKKMKFTIISKTTYFQILSNKNVKGKHYKTQTLKENDHVFVQILQTSNEP